jgi:hypothetical protein
MCSAMWTLFPVLRANTTAAEMLEYAGVLVVCASGFYSIGVLLSTFLDEVWRLWGSLICVGALWLLFNRTPLAPSVNIFRAISDGSPLIAHTIPWPAMSLSLGMALVLLFAGLKIAQTREY